MKMDETTGSAPVQSVSQKVMAIAVEEMLSQLKDSRWYQTAPAYARAEDPVIEIVGVEYREVATLVGGGLGGATRHSKPFLIGRVEVGGIAAKLALRLDFGIGGFLVMEGEG